MAETQGVNGNEVLNPSTDKAYKPLSYPNVSDTVQSKSSTAYDKGGKPDNLPANNRLSSADILKLNQQSVTALQQVSQEMASKGISGTEETTSLSNQIRTDAVNNYLNALKTAEK